MCCLDCSTSAQVVALKFFQQNACQDDDWRSRGTVERVSETQDADTEDAHAILLARDLLFSLPASFLLSQAGILLGKAQLTMDKPLSGARAQNTCWQDKPWSVHQSSSWWRLSTSHDGTAAAQDKPLLRPRLLSSRVCRRRSPPPERGCRCRSATLSIAAPQL